MSVFFYFLPLVSTHQPAYPHPPFLPCTMAHRPLPLPPLPPKRPLLPPPVMAILPPQAPRVGGGHPPLELRGDTDLLHPLLRWCGRICGGSSSPSWRVGEHGDGGPDRLGKDRERRVNGGERDYRRQLRFLFILTLSFFNSYISVPITSVFSQSNPYTFQFLKF